MHSFSEQCLDMARSMLGHNLDSIQPDGTVLPANGEQSAPDEPGHVAYALGEYLPRHRRNHAQGPRPDRPRRPLHHGADVHRAARGKRPRLRLARPPLLRPLQGAQSRLGAPRRGNPASASTSSCSTAATTTTTGRPSTSPRPSRASASACPRRTRPRA